MSSNKLQHSIFLISFLICCVVFLITIISLTTENWVIVRPYRQIRTPDAQSIKNQIIQTFNSSLQNLTMNEIPDFSFVDDSIEDEQIIDLISKIDCKRFHGFIKFGLFKGTWLLNYGFGCKYRLNRVSSKFLILFLNRLISYHIE